jgi:hypothetical protein
MPRVRKCATCGKEFVVTNAKGRPHKFCSEACRPSAALITKTCQMCGTLYTHTNLKVWRDSKYCSSSCAGLATRNRITKICIICSKPYEIKASEDSVRRCCSWECMSKSRERKVKQICKGCGKEFFVIPSFVGHIAYCSKSCKSDPERRYWKNVRKGENENDCWIWIGPTDSRGYGSLKIGESIKSTHRIAYEWEYGPIPSGMLVCHHCDNPPCVNPKHLFLGTHQDNVDDMKSKSRDAKGGDFSFTKLKDDDIRAIRRMYKNGCSQQEIADHFMVTQGNISAILTGKTWKHIT